MSSETLSVLSLTLAEAKFYIQSDPEILDDSVPVVETIRDSLTFEVDFVYLYCGVC
jgi:hypothetical protein